jgi:hypothetical protein
VSEKNDSLANVNAAIGLIISQVPYLGAAYNAIASAHTEKRIEKLEQQMCERDINPDQFTKLFETDSGYAFFVRFCKSVVETESMKKIEIFANILKSNCEQIVDLDIQYKTIILETIASMSELELLSIFYIKKYFEDVPELERCILKDAEYMEVFVENMDKEEKGIKFKDFLIKQTHGDIILKEFEFLSLRMVSLGILYRGDRISLTTYYVSGFGRQLLEFIDEYNL